MTIQTPAPGMTVDEFLAWAEDRPGRHELVGGHIVAMAPERVRHARVKGSVYMALQRAIGQAGAACEAFPDGMTVRIDQTTAFEPDALVRCGAPLDGGMIEVPDPVIVVEVLSLRMRNVDAGSKFAGYFALPRLRHYLMIDPERRVVVHHRRDGEAIATRILGSGVLRLDPPVLDLAVEDLFGAPEAAS